MPLYRFGIPDEKPEKRPQPGELVKAARKGNVKMVKNLLDRGSDINERDENDGTPLILAVCKGHIDVVLMLVSRGVDVNAENVLGDTALMWAAAGGHTEMIRLLADKGAVNEENGYGRDALSLARRNKHTKTIQMLEYVAKQQRSHDEEQSRQPSETWVLMGTEKAAHICIYPDLQRKLTDIFDFAARKRLVVTENLQTKAEALTPSESFDSLPREIVEKALENFTRLGGVVDRDFALYGITRPNKPGF